MNGYGVVLAALAVGTVIAVIQGSWPLVVLFVLVAGYQVYAWRKAKAEEEAEAAGRDGPL